METGPKKKGASEGASEHYSEEELFRQECFPHKEDNMGHVL